MGQPHAVKRGEGPLTTMRSSRESLTRSSGSLTTDDMGQWAPGGRVHAVGEAHERR